MRKLLLMMVATLAVTSSVMLVRTMAQQVEYAAPTDTEWSTSTLPPLPTTTTTAPVAPIKPIVINRALETVNPWNMGVSDICRLAETNPSPDGLVYALVRPPETVENWPEQALKVEFIHQLLWQAIQEDSCSPGANDLLDRTLPYLVEAEG